MRAARFARDAQPEQKPGEVVETSDRPRSWEELDCPDEIELELHPGAIQWNYNQLVMAIRHAGLSGDRVEFRDAPEPMLALTGQAEDCWYAGVPRGRRLVLRRI